jgi:hypothetical protein
VTESASLLQLSSHIDAPADKKRLMKRSASIAVRKAPDLFRSWPDFRAAAQYAHGCRGPRRLALALDGPGHHQYYHALCDGDDVFEAVWTNAIGIRHFPQMRILKAYAHCLRRLKLASWLPIDHRM